MSDSRYSGSSNTSGGGGCGCLGSIIAVMLSIKTFGLTWWVIPHFIFSWFYVAYWVIFHSGWIR
jgi:hypothetical protein